MSTPPKITATELNRCLATIRGRHRKVDDRNLELMPDDAAGMLDYLRKFDSGHLPRWVRQADVLDALTLNVWLWWEDKRRELWALRRGVELGHFLTTLGAPVGISSRQGVRDRIDRLEALLRFDRPNEQLTREARRQAWLDELRKDVESRWVREHAAELREVVDGLLEAAERYGLVEDEDREWLDELARDARDDAFTPASMPILGMAAAEVRTCPGVLGLDSTRPHKVHHVLERAEKLRGQFAELGKTGTR